MMFRAFHGFCFVFGIVLDVSRHFDIMQSRLMNGKKDEKKSMADGCRDTASESESESNEEPGEGAMTMGLAANILASSVLDHPCLWDHLHGDLSRSIGFGHA